MISRPTLLMALAVATALLMLSLISVDRSAHIPSIELRAVKHAVADSGAQGYKCPAADAQRQAQKFYTFRRANTRYSSCPQVPILEHMARQSFVEGRNMVFVDVGANKGYSISEVLEAFDSTSIMNPRTLGSFLIGKTGSKKLCGACQDCQNVPDEELLQERKTPRSITVHALEPGPANLKLLNMVRDWSNHSEFFVHQVAVSNQNGFVRFPVQRAGSEVGWILNSDSDSKDSVEVRSITLDSFFEENQLEDVDILKIDTEGFDPDALRGAQSVIAMKKAKVIQFEYHKLNLWSPTHPRTDSLENVVEKMDFNGYDCYFMGRDTLFRLTGCWDPRYEIRYWSNVICVARREHALSQLFFGLSRYLFEAVDVNKVV